MHVLMITGDKKMVAGYPRFDLQASAVEKLIPLYMGRGSVWPTLPKELFDVVTVQDPFLRGVFGLVAARRMYARFNVQVHTDLSAQSLGRRILARIVLRRADSIRVVSEKIQQQVLRMGVVAPIRVLPIFIDIEAFTHIAPHTPSSGTKTILWVGRFESEKNPLYAISVLKEILQKGIDARLVILGSGSLEALLKEKAKNLPVEFPGWQDPKPYLAQADVVLSTSVHESYGASIIEALAAAVPVVAPDIGIAKEAGAIVGPKAALAELITTTLRSGVRGELKLSVPTASVWVEEWKKTLA